MKISNKIIFGMNKVVMSLTILLCLYTTAAYSQTKKKESDKPAKKDPKELFEVQKDVPTIIDSDSLSVDQNTKLFKYSGNVKVTQADLTLMSDFLVGSYTDQNKIKELTATKNVIITKGEAIKATSDKAIYNAESGLITLTINPQLIQDGSLLSAETIKINLNDSKSSAEGKVRVTLLNSEKIKNSIPNPMVNPSPSAIGTTKTPITDIKRN